MKVGRTTCETQSAVRGLQTGQHGAHRHTFVRHRVPYLCEVHAQTNLRQQMHNDALVLFHRLTLAIIVTVIVAIKLIWRQQQKSHMAEATSPVQYV